MMQKIVGTEVPAQALGVWWTGQGGFIVKTDNRKIIVVDPYFSNSVGRHGPQRLVPVPVRPADRDSRCASRDRRSL